MLERRSEFRLMCSELVRLRGGRGPAVTANLEDISPSGACLQLEQPVAVRARVRLLGRWRGFQGEVRYCISSPVGYLAGIRFDIAGQWSREEYAPEHLLDPRELHSAGRRPVPS